MIKEDYSSDKEAYVFLLLVSSNFFFSWIQRWLPSVECLRTTPAAARTPILGLWMLCKRRFVL